MGSPLLLLCINAFDVCGTVAKCASQAVEKRLFASSPSERRYKDTLPMYAQYALLLIAVTLVPRVTATPSAPFGSVCAP